MTILNVHNDKSTLCLYVHVTAFIPRIAGRHAELREEGGGVYSLEPLQQNLRLLLNGRAVVERSPIKHNDR